MSQNKQTSQNNFEECIKCTVCTVYCPVIEVNPLFPGPKQAGPDGERYRLKNDFFYDANLKYCMNCKRCENACPSGVKIADIIHTARMKYGKIRPSLRDRMLAETDFLGTMARPVAPIVNAVAASNGGRVIMDKMLGIDHHRVFPKYTVHGFKSWFRKNKQASQGEYAKTLTFFHGCSGEYQHPEVSKAFVEVMNALGWGVKLMNEKCCGVAMISNGLWGHAMANAKHNVAEIRRIGLPTVTLSSTCTLTIRDEYPNILGIDNSDIRESIVIAEKFICDLIDKGEAKLVFRDDFKARASYHIPCHMEKLGWSIFTRRLMEMIPGMELTMLDSNCCGIAGTYGFKKESYGYAQAIGQPLFDEIKAENPDFVVCECETCKWQIEMSTGYTVLNPILVLANALDLEKTTQVNKNKK